jgi:hypothetical protein
LRLRKRTMAYLLWSSSTASMAMPKGYIYCIPLYIAAACQYYCPVMPKGSTAPANNPLPCDHCFAKKDKRSRETTLRHASYQVVLSLVAHSWSGLC